MDVDPYQGLEPAELWSHFAALNAIPRPSGHESKARAYVLGVAEAAGASAEVDARGNAVVRVPPAAGTRGPAVAVQAHLDMVCDADAGVAHDWERDPVVPRRDGDRIFASGTTLGADNGIGVAAALSLIGSGVRHSGLELLFTVDEESGRWGALDLDASLLTAQALVNLDSEDAGALTIGSAGGSDVEVTMSVPREDLPGGMSGLGLRVAGLEGGHSGLQIHEGRGNAIKLIAAALERLRKADVGPRLCSLRGGSTSTAIAREARAELAIARDRLPDVEALVASFRDELRTRWANAEPSFTLELETCPAPESALAEEAASRLLTLLEGLPHGVLAESPRFEGTVETSANLAIVEIESGEARVTVSVRSLSAERLSEAQELIRTIAAEGGAGATVKDAYPSWEPRERSALVDATVSAYRRTYGKSPRLDVLHGGLECGAIVAAKPALEAISFGPRILGAHTPEEHVYASTVATTWKLLTTLLEDLADG